MFVMGVDTIEAIEENASDCVAQMRTRVQIFPLLLTTEAPAHSHDLTWSHLACDGGPHLKEWLAAQGRRTDGPGERLEPKTRCSYLIGHMAHRLSCAMATLILDGGRFMINPGRLEELRLRPWDEPWTHVTLSGIRESGIVIHIDPLIDPRILLPTKQLDDLARINLCRLTLVRVFDPIIAQLRPMTGLSEQAQWRLVADMAASAFLRTAKDLDDADRGMALGRLLVRGERSKLTNKQVDYIDVTLHDDPPEEDWFLSRGGCCRWYTTQSPVDYCATCVLLKPEQKREKLASYMRERRDERQEIAASS